MKIVVKEAETGSGRGARGKGVGGEGCGSEWFRDARHWKTGEGAGGGVLC